MAEDRNVPLTVLEVEVSDGEAALEVPLLQRSQPDLEIRSNDRALSTSFWLWSPAIASLILLQSSNISFLTTTQSLIANDLGLSDEARWLSLAYLIPMASFGPLAGKLGENFSIKYCISSCGILFATGSTVTGSSSSLAPFILGRLIMGIGAAGIFTLSLVIIIQAAPAKYKGVFVGILNSFYTIGVGSGALVAGILMPKIGWRATFLLQAGLALCASVFILRFMEVIQAREENTQQRSSVLETLSTLDLVGSFLLISTLFLILVCLSLMELSIPLLISAFVCLLCFTFWETRVASKPLIPVSLLSSPALLCSCFAILLLMSARWLLLFYTPIYGLMVRDWTPAASGSVLIAANGGFSIGGILVGWLHIKQERSFYWTCLLLFGLFSGDLATLSAISVPDTPTVIYILTMFCNGSITGAILHYSLAHLIQVTSFSDRLMATALITTFRGFASSFGAAIGGGIFARALSSSLRIGLDRIGFQNKEQLIKSLIGKPALAHQLSGQVAAVVIQASAQTVGLVFLSGSFLALGGFVFQAGVSKRTGALKRAIEPSGGFSGEEEEVL